MEDYTEFKKMNYRKRINAATEEGVVMFDPDSLNDVVGADNLSYNEYLDVQIKSLGKVRPYFAACFFNFPIEFKGQIEKIKKDKLCFERIYISGMFPDGGMFDGKEDHVWMNRAGFEGLKRGDCVQFFAEVYRYIKTGRGKHIDYALRNPQSIKVIESYELPTDDELIYQGINRIICDTCIYDSNCHKSFCLLGPDRELLKEQMHAIIKGYEETGESGFDY